MLLAFLVARILLRSLSSLLLLAYANGKGITMGDYYDYIYIYIFYLFIFRLIMNFFISMVMDFKALVVKGFVCKTNI